MSLRVCAVLYTLYSYVEVNTMCIIFILAHFVTLLGSSETLAHLAGVVFIRLIAQHSALHGRDFYSSKLVSSFR